MQISLDIICDYIINNVIKCIELKHMILRKMCVFSKNVKNPTISSLIGHQKVMTSQHAIEDDCTLILSSEISIFDN